MWTSKPLGAWVRKGCSRVRESPKERHRDGAHIWGGMGSGLPTYMILLVPIHIRFQRVTFRLRRHLYVWGSVRCRAQSSSPPHLCVWSALTWTKQPPPPWGDGMDTSHNPVWPKWGKIVLLSGKSPKLF